MRLSLLLACLVLPAAAVAQSPDAGAPAPDGVRPLTLDDAIKLALANNQAIKVDAYTKAIARANLLAAYGSFDPAISFRRSYSESNSASFTSTDTGFIPVTTVIQSDNYSISLGGLTPWGASYSIGGTATNQRGSYNAFTNNFLTTGGITVTQPLLRGFGFSGNASLLGVRIGKANRAISDWQYRQTVIDTVTRVVTAYSNLVFAHEYLRTAEKARNLAAGLVAENEKRFHVGSMSENDVTSARAQMALREEGIVAAEQLVRDSDNQLRLLLGESAFANDGPLLAVDPPVMPEVDVRPAEDLKKAYELRPDYQQARLGLNVSRYNAAYARNQLLPQVDFVGNYGYTGLDQDFAASRRMVSNRENRAYSAGLQVTVPLTFTEGRGKARAARLQLRKDEANLKLAEENIALSVAEAGGQVASTRKRVAAAQAARNLNDALLQAELKRLRAGTGSTFSVLYQQIQLTSADVQFAQALADQRRAVANYEHEIGTTLDDYHLTLTDQ
jgi:outer membrane protein